MRLIFLGLHNLSDNNNDINDGCDDVGNAVDTDVNDDDNNSVSVNDNDIGNDNCNSL